ncbi:MAG: hypothetical protein WD646_02505 [Actinomycetota bacterium]
MAEPDDFDALVAEAETRSFEGWDFSFFESRLPFRDSSLDLVIDRHEAFRATEVARVLRPGGTFLTQQVGSRNEMELNDALGDEVVPCLSPTLDDYVAQLEHAGLAVTDAREAFPQKP